MTIMSIGTMARGTMPLDHNIQSSYKSPLKCHTSMGLETDKTCLLPALPHAHAGNYKANIPSEQMYKIGYRQAA